MEESIHVRFDDKLDPEKSKLVEKLADLEITLAGSDEKTKSKIQKQLKSQLYRKDQEIIQTSLKI